MAKRPIKNQQPPLLMQQGMMDSPAPPVPTPLELQELLDPTWQTLQNPQQAPPQMPQAPQQGGYGVQYDAPDPLQLNYGPIPGTTEPNWAQYQQSIFDPSRAALQRLLSDTIQSANRKPTRWERGMQVGQDVWRGIGAPLTGLFGPVGFEKGAKEWIDAEKKRQDEMRSARRTQRNDSLSALKDLADIMGTADKSKMNEFAEVMKLYNMQQQLPFALAGQEALARQRNAAAGAYDRLGGYRDAQAEKTQEQTKTIKGESQSKIDKAKADAETAAQKTKTEVEATGMKAAQKELYGAKKGLADAETGTAQERTRMIKKQGSKYDAETGAASALEEQRKARTGQINSGGIKGGGKPSRLKDLPYSLRSRIEGSINHFAEKGIDTNKIKKWLLEQHGVTF